MEPVTPDWLQQKPACVIMCGGNSSRFGGAGHKSMAAVNEKPIIEHVIDYWRQFTDDFIFVVKNGRDELTAHIETLDIRARFVEPVALKGIADGLLCAEPLIERPFIMVLGDCFCAGDFRFDGHFDYAIGVLPQATEAQVCRNYAVTAENDSVTSVEEKPDSAPSDLCGMGFYFFQPDIFDYVRRTQPSPRSGELEITDVLATLLEHQVDLRALMLDGVYVNLTTTADLPVIAAALRDYPNERR